jgi:Arm DNA-binding domain
MPPVNFTGRFTQSFLDNPAVGTHTDGSGLYLAVRKGGKARSWSFRRRGKRRTIGSAFRISLKEAEAQVRRFRDQIDNNEDPFAKAPEEEKGETFSSAAAAFYAHKCQSEWGKDAQALGRSMIRAYVDNRLFADKDKPLKDTAVDNRLFADKPLKDIGVKELSRIFKPTWNSKPVIAKRAVLMLKEMFDIAIADERYQGKNPALITKNAPLRKLLGKQPIGGHRN